MAIVKTGNPTIDDMFEIKTKPIQTFGHLGRDRIPKLQITPSKLNGVYTVAGQQAIYTGMQTRPGREPQHIFLTRTYSTKEDHEDELESIWAYRIPTSEIIGLDKDKKHTLTPEQIVSIQMHPKSTKQLYDNNPLQQCSNEALLAKMLLEKYLPRQKTISPQAVPSVELTSPVEECNYNI